MVNTCLLKEKLDQNLKLEYAKLLNEVKIT